MDLMSPSKGTSRSLNHSSEGRLQSHLSSVFFVVEPSKIIFSIKNTIPQKEDRILLYNGLLRTPETVNPKSYTLLYS